MMFGDNESGNLAVKLLKVITENDTGKPHVWLAALMMTSRSLQILLEKGYKVDALKMAIIREKAMEIADSMQINVNLKDDPK